MIIGPVFGQASVPINVRVLLTIALSLLLTPLLADRNDRGFDRLDLNGDGQLSADEIPPGLTPRYEKLKASADLPEDAPLRRSQYDLQMTLPESVWDYARIAAGELVLGLLLGTGVLAVLSGLQIAGQLIDQQSGLASAKSSIPTWGDRCR